MVAITINGNEVYQIQGVNDLLSLSPEVAHSVVNHGKKEITKLFDSVEKLEKLAEKAPKAADSVVCHGKEEITKLYDSVDKLEGLAEKAPEAADSVVCHNLKLKEDPKFENIISRIDEKCRQLKDEQSKKNKM